MAFSNGYDGDQVQLNYILKTINEKRVLIPGLVTNPALSVAAMGESASFYVNGKTNAKKGVAGGKVDYASVGGKRIDLFMRDAMHIADVIPRVNFATVTADVIGARVIQETISAMNAHNTEGVKAIEAEAEAKTLEGADAYEQLVNAIAQFEIDNKATGGKPFSALVSPAFYAQLQLDKRFVDGIERDSVARTGFIGLVAGIYTIKTLDLTEGFILVNPEGIAAPINVNTLDIVNGTSVGYPGGVVIGGELGYGFKVVTRAEDVNLGTTGYFAAKFTA